METLLKTSCEDGVGWIVLDAPSKRNAMSEALMAEYVAAIRRMKEDDAIRVVVLTSTGPAFCAGGDLNMLTAQLDWSGEQNRRHMARYYREYLSAIHLDVPTIAAINGDAIGAGLSFTLAYDIRIAAESARLGVTYLNLGLHPGMGTMHLLPVIVGEAYAAELIFTGKLISGTEAARVGLVNRAVEVDQVRNVALEMAREIAAKPTSAMRIAKRALVKRKLNGLEESLDYEATAQMGSFASSEMRTSLEKISTRASRVRP